MQRKAMSADERRRWRDTALVIARKISNDVGLDTLGGQRHSCRTQSPRLEPRKVDPIDELKRLIRK